MEALILSGGRGTRLRPLTLYQPKPLLPILNLPFLSYPCALLRGCGVRDVTICTADDLAPYRGFFAQEKKRGSSVRGSRETKELGTAGALKNAEKFLKSDLFFVFNGDVLTDIPLADMIEFHKYSGSAITIALVPVANPQAYGLILTDPNGRVDKFIEKPQHLEPSWGPPYYINAGIYLFNRTVLDLIPKGQKYSSERELFPGALEADVPMYGFKSASTYWIDIGTPEKYLEANLDVQHGKFKADLKGKTDRGGSVKVHKSAQVGDGVILGNGCKIEEGAVLENAVLLDKVRVGAGAQIQNCIIGAGASIGANASVKNARVIGNFSKITDHSIL